MAAHSKGPFEIIERKPTHNCYGKDAIECLIAPGGGNAIAIIGLGGPAGSSAAPEDVRANARLFAESPAMFDIIQKAHRFLRKSGYDMTEIDDILKRIEG